MLWLLSDFLLVMVMLFLENVRSPARSENHMCSHPHTGDATSLYFITKSLAHQISSANFSAITSPARGWLHMQFFAVRWQQFKKKITQKDM